MHALFIHVIRYTVQQWALGPPLRRSYTRTHKQPLFLVDLRYRLTGLVNSPNSHPSQPPSGPGTYILLFTTHMYCLLTLLHTHTAFLGRPFKPAWRPTGALSAPSLVFCLETSNWCNQPAHSPPLAKTSFPAQTPRQGEGGGEIHNLHCSMCP